MGFFKRLFDSDYRAALAAEAAGDLELAAERYAISGEHEAACRVHLSRAARADSRKDEIAALRDALHWAPAENDCRRKASRSLGDALLARARAEGVSTARDRERVREAASLLEEAGDFARAGEAYESIEDDRAAAASYKRGGLVDRMEEVLGRSDERNKRARELRESFAEYELAMRGGDRDHALCSIRAAVEAAEKKSEYRRLLDELESVLITGSRARLKVRRGEGITLVGGPRILIGRDTLCDLVLRSSGVSRRHAELTHDGGGFLLRDAGSRNGTRVGGMPLSGSVPIRESGCFELGDDCEINYQVGGDGRHLSLAIENGLDQGAILVAAPEGEPISLEPVGIAAHVYFRSGRPILQNTSGTLQLNGERLVHGDVQLVHGDLLSIGGIELEVE